MKVFISVDIEGATGIASFSQCGRADGQHYDYAFARRMLTGDVNAAIRGARAAGATEVIVKDAHGNVIQVSCSAVANTTETEAGPGRVRNRQRQSQSQAQVLLRV